jgi:hypothetical protein
MAPGRGLQGGPEDSRSRRQLLAGGGAAALGGALLLGGCGKSAPAADVIAFDKHSPGAESDVRILNGLLDLEYRGIAAYTASVPLLAAVARQEAKAHKPSHPARKPAAPKQKAKSSRPLSTAALFAPNAAAAFLGQEIDHTLELKKIIKQAGAKPARPAPSYNLVNPNPSSKDDVLVALHGIEQAQLMGYLQAVTLLTLGELRSAVAAIFANHAQHVMVVRMQLGLAPIPAPFVTGQE